MPTSNNNNKKVKIKCMECKCSFNSEDIRFFPNLLTLEQKPICRYCLELPPEHEDEELDAELELEKQLITNPSGRTPAKMLKE